jgi:hypothetical protein
MAGYVGMQRLACDRMGLIWNRTRALAGVVLEPAFTDKVATGGRLDIFKGLEFYLATLPDFHVVDSTQLTWRVGEQVHYTLELTPAPALTYKFSLGGLGTGAVVDGSGKLLWVPSLQDTGMHIVTLTAAGATLLRKRFTLQVQHSPPVALENTGANGNAGWVPLRLAGQEFRAGREVLRGRHWVEVQGTDALGKVQLLKQGWMEYRDFHRPWDLGMGSASLTQIQVRVDGILLARAK